jgi:hypothetical protein
MSEKPPERDRLKIAAAFLGLPLVLVACGPVVATQIVSSLGSYTDANFTRAEES